jgi:hypothetical protein
MKRLIILKVEWLKKSEGQARHQEVFDDAIKQFKEQLNSFFETKTVKILKEYPESKEVLIEFPEIVWEKLNKGLIDAEVVSIIDSHVEGV